MTLRNRRALPYAALALLLSGCTDNAQSGVDQGTTDLGVADLISTAPPLPSFAWTGIIGTGQSLSVGVQGMPVISATQPFSNLKLSDPNFTGDLTGAAGVGALLLPLVEPLRANNPNFPAGPGYPNNLYGETPHSAMGTQLTALYRGAGGSGDLVSVHSAIGESGQSITVIRKNGTGNSYAAALYEARAITALAKQAGKTFGYGAVLLTHGETDAADANYESEIEQLASDFDTDLRAITGQSQTIPLLLTQQNTFPGAAGSAPSTLAQWKLGVDNPGHILCVGPKYQYEYAVDHVHLTANGYRRLGQKYAQVYYQAVLQKKDWRPLQPSAVQKSGTTLTVTFDVPVPPLQWDDRLPAPHQSLNKQWAPGRGFEVSDKTGPIGIVDVQLVPPAQVQLTLARAPGTGLTLAYAMTQDVAGYTGGLAESRGGQLRDSDATIGYDTETISCQVQNGSPLLTAVGATDFANRSLHDVVVGTQLALDTVVIDRPTPSQLMLSAPFTGPTGTAQLVFHNDLHNYAVQFSMPVM